MKKLSQEKLIDTIIQFCFFLGFDFFFLIFSALSAMQMNRFRKHFESQRIFLKKLQEEI